MAKKTKLTTRQRRFLFAIGALSLNDGKVSYSPERSAMANKLLKQLKNSQKKNVEELGIKGARQKRAQEIVGRLKVARKTAIKKGADVKKAVGKERRFQQALSKTFRAVLKKGN